MRVPRMELSAAYEDEDVDTWYTCRSSYMQAFITAQLLQVRLSTY